MSTRHGVLVPAKGLVWKGNRPLLEMRVAGEDSEDTLQPRARRNKWKDTNSALPRQVSDGKCVRENGSSRMRFIKLNATGYGPFEYACARAPPTFVFQGGRR